MIENTTETDIYSFRAIIEPEQPSGYFGFIPSLPGCFSNGDTVEETKFNSKEALQGYLKGAFDNNAPIPQEPGIEFIPVVEVSRTYIDNQPKLKIKVNA